VVVPGPVVVAAVATMAIPVAVAEWSSGGSQECCGHQGSTDNMGHIALNPWMWR